MTPPMSLDQLPDDLREPARALLAALREQSPHKRAILMEALQLIGEQQETSDMKLLAHALQEIRKGFDVFRPYKAFRKVSVFGSARTPPDHPRYRHVRECARRLKEEGFMIITGGGGGMMQAANEGAGERHSFGININLPMEQRPNPVVDGSPRHFYCKYFFTRKLFFLKESDAVILSPGGFGTLDEAFETLTLLQTGRNPPIPVVLLDAPDDDYWGPFMRSWLRRLVSDGLISPNDTDLLFHTDSIEAAVDHIKDFYINYDSFRYVGEWVLLRLIRPLSDASIERLNAEFSDVLREGRIEQVWNWPKSDDEQYLNLPRLRLKLDRAKVNTLPSIIRRMNALHLRERQQHKKSAE